MIFHEMWHGVGSLEVWKRLEGGHLMEIPAQYTHDPGDYGRALYFTDLQLRAKAYAARHDDKRLLVQVTLELVKPLVIDWRPGGAAAALDKRHPANLMLEMLENRFGNPVQGVPEIREAVALRWRRELMAEGYDAIVVHHKEDTEVASYDPVRSVRDLKFVEIPMEGR